MTIELSSKQIEVAEGRSGKNLNLFQRLNSWLDTYAERKSKRCLADIKNGYYPYWE